MTKIIREIHAESRGSYGFPRVHAELRLGIEVSRKRVEQMMRVPEIQGIIYGGAAAVTWSMQPPRKTWSNGSSPLRFFVA